MTPVSPLTDEDLMRAYQAGDSAAFDVLYARYAPRIYGYLKRRISDPARLEEVFQNVFLKFHKTRAQYNPALPVVPWIFTVARSVLIDAARSGQIFESRHADESELANIAAPIAEKERSLPAEALAQLGKQDRRALELRYFDELSFSDMAKRLKVEEATARQRVSRAVRRLKLVVKGGRAK